MKKKENLAPNQENYAEILARWNDLSKPQEQTEGKYPLKHGILASCTAHVIAAYAKYKLAYCYYLETNSVIMLVKIKTIYLRVVLTRTT
jgi:hypothetical protein